MLPYQIDHVDLLTRLYGCYPKRAEAQKVLDSLRAQCTPPEKGKLVGTDGPDYSFRLSLIWHSEGGTTGPRPFPTRPIIQSVCCCKTTPLHPEKGWELRPRMSYARHHYLDVVSTSKEGLLRWTRWAKKIGLRHDGKWGYEFPPKRVWNTQEGILNLLKGVRWAPPPVKRSERSSARRKERRKILQGISNAPTLRVAVVSRLRFSPKTLRKCWASLPKKDWVPWSTYRERTPQGLVLSPSGLKGRYVGPMPDLVLGALLKIYSKLTCYPIIRDHRFPPVPKVVEVSPITVPQQRGIKDRLNQIEEDGFHETYTWFNLNHYLSKKGE